MRRRVVLLLALLLSMTACLADTSDPTVVAADPSSSAPTGPQASAGSTTDTPDALAFIADTVDGDPFDGGAHAGQDLMLWFWAPW